MSLTRAPEAMATLLAQAREFIDHNAIPREDLRAAHNGDAVQRASDELLQQAKALGLVSPRLPAAQGGLGLSWEECCAYLEVAGRSFLGPAALQCAAPTQPDIAVLEQLASPWQRERYLGP